MKNISFFLTIFLALSALSCKNGYLDEVPLDRFSPENLLVNESGFDAVLTALYESVRSEHHLSGNFDYMNLGTDVVRWGRADSRGFADYTLINSYAEPSRLYWNWAYEKVLPRANLILDNIDNMDIDISEESRNNIKGQALFFRGYVYNILANLFGGVPIVETLYSEPRFDFERESRENVLLFAMSDLEAASRLLAIDIAEDGRVPRAAAFHLLSEVYITLAMLSGDDSYYDKSIGAADKVIGKEAGDYEIATQRFGPASSSPGDVFSDVFAYGQINRSEGNKEVIWAYQIELYILGNSGSQLPRLWAPQYDVIRTPNGIKNNSVDSLPRGIGVNSPTNYAKYYIWDDPNDIRNSKHNIRRTFYYNNPADPEYFQKPIRTAYGSDGNLYVTREDGTLTTQRLDTLFGYYPWFRKIDGHPSADQPSSGNTAKDMSRMRVSETYLLRAEAYFRKGDLDKAAADINVVRGRAKASLIGASDVTEDYILDERARELLVEEPRMRTLIRMGRLVDRVRKYNSEPAGTGGRSAGSTIQEHNALWPIPQAVIDANSGAVLEQNPGYN
ncbi:Starch-binding associating with outer membrane [Parapedobacter composti]|uniref:Starch-binding associating with outer membrane n=1 Tax=Parapedobacter composti TaxID=623281 RepID=A0A1I1H016_9SPHI|nr:RagB/SusD family nutrient uptake outer membrane protein [Parapedobacter composti]SFC16882.1 Starch-binding associating with outer membrane [Parapedobacter composti]